MKLYKHNKGQWFGTQAEAKASRHPWICVDVPTDKPSLLDWLNNDHHIRVEPLTPEVPAYQSNIAKPHAWQTIRECAERASIKDLSVAMAVYLNRVDELADHVAE